MLIRLRQFLTIFLLLIFSLENVANASINNTSREKFSVSHNLTTQKENVTFFTWIIEQNENEERDDDKAHGLTAELSPVSSFQAHSSDFIEAGFHSSLANTLRDSTYILKLVCRLTI